MLNNYIILVVAVLLISACSESGKKQIAFEAPSQEVLLNNDMSESKIDKKKVTTEMDSEVLYMLLVAEIAGQREQFGISLEGYLQAAKRVNDPQVAERAAKIAVFLKENKKSSEAVSIWLAKDPASLTARKIAVLTALRSDNEEDAVKHLKFLLEADPAGFEDSLIEIVKLMGQEGKSELIYNVLEKIGVQYPENATVYLVHAFLAMQNKQYDVAQEKIVRVLDLQPNWSKAIVFQAQLAVMNGDLDRAIIILRQSIEKLPKNQSLKKLLAQVLVKSNRYEEASEQYRQMLDSNPEDAESRFSLALIYLQLEEDDQAKNMFEKLLDKPRWLSQASFYIGRIEARKENVDIALIWFDKVTTGALVFEARIAAYTLLLDKERFTEAAVRLKNMREVYAEHEIRLVLLEAEFFNKQKQYQKAFDVLTHALLKKPEQKELLYTRALIAERLGKLDVLESDLMFILEKNPDDASALNALGYTLVDRTDRLGEAEKYLQKAIALQPEEPVIMDSYGWLLFKQGKLKMALDYLQKAYAKEQEGEIAAHLIEVLWELGEKDDALKLLENALDSSPEDEYLLEVQKRFNLFN